MPATAADRNAPGMAADPQAGAECAPRGSTSADHWAGRHRAAAEVILRQAANPPLRPIPDPAASPVAVSARSHASSWCIFPAAADVARSHEMAFTPATASAEQNQAGPSNTNRAGPPHETLASCDLDHDGDCGRRGRIGGVRGPARLRSGRRFGSRPRSKRAADGILPRKLWRLRRRAASISRRRVRPCRASAPVQMR